MEKPSLTTNLLYSEPVRSLWLHAAVPLIKKKVKILRGLRETEARSTRPELLQSPCRVLGCSCYSPCGPSACPPVQSIGLCVLGNPNGERCGKTCLEERDNQWLGVSLSRQPKENGSIVVCINGCSCVSVCQTAFIFLMLLCQTSCLFFIHRLVDIDGKMSFTQKMSTNFHMVFVLLSLLIFELN